MNGIVYIVGAGPGDPGLITVKGLNCLRQADVVLYDRLIPLELLDEAPLHAERINVGKEPARHRPPRTRARHRPTRYPEPTARRCRRSARRPRAPSAGTAPGPAPARCRSAGDRCSACSCRAPAPPSFSGSRRWVAEQAGSAGRSTKPRRQPTWQQRIERRR